MPGRAISVGRCRRPRSSRSSTSASCASGPTSRPAGHVHPAEEETIYCAAGRGRIVTPDGTADVEPGVVVHVSPGTFHATEADGPDDLELVCVFSPPVVSGSYETKPAS